MGRSERRAGDGRRRGADGFTLLEVLIVVFILGFIAAIMTIAVSSTLKKQRLEAAAKQLGSFIMSAHVGAAERSIGAFVVITAPDADNQRAVWLVADTDRDDTLDFDPANPQAGPDMPVPGGTMNLTWDIGVPPVQAIPGGVNEWPQVGGNSVLLCDPRGYSFNVGAVPTERFNIPVRISLTHNEMLLGELRPTFRYDITVGPLWTVAVDRVGY